MATLTTSSAPSQSSAPRTFWRRVDQGLWVATREGDHVGRVERSARRFHAYSGRGLDLGTFATLGEAEGEVAARA